MKRGFALGLAMLLMMLCGCRAVAKNDQPFFADAPGMDAPPRFDLGNEAGAIASGGRLAQERVAVYENGEGRGYQQYLYVALEDGIYKGRVDEEAEPFRCISRDKASCLNRWEGRVYYIRTFEKEGQTYEEIVSIDTKSGDKTVHAPALPIGEKYVVFDANGHVSRTLRSGYSDLYVGEDYLFYIADSEVPGRSVLDGQDGRRVVVEWEAEHALHRVDLSSGEDHVLDAELGNGACRLNVCDEDGKCHLYYTAVVDGGDGVQLTELHRMGLEGTEHERLMVTQEEIHSFAMDYQWKDWVLVRGEEGNDALKMEYIYGNTALHLECIPKIAEPLAAWNLLYWLDGERTEDGWENVRLMRADAESCSPMAEIGRVASGSEFEGAAIGKYVNHIWLLTKTALYRVDVDKETYEDHFLTKIFEITQ